MSSSSPDHLREPMPAEAPPTTRTMPPPELLDRPAPDSASKIVLEHVRPDVPIARYEGPRAEEAHLRGQVDEARATGDLAVECEASATLARLLASRGTDLDTAVTLAARALEIADDPALRTDLAGWLAGLGQPAQAAEMLRGLLDPERPLEASRLLVKTAVLLARASDPAAAAESLREAAALDPQQAMASELLGTLAGWAPEAVPPEVAAAAFLDAAERREAAQEKEAAFEDRLRAFDIAPHDESAAAALSGALASRARLGASNEIMRWHAAAVAELDPPRARKLHLQRMLSALLEGDSASAIGAMLDAGLEGEVEGEVATDVDEALSHAGLYDLLAVRIALRAERQAGETRSETYQTLADLYAGVLDRPEEAVDAWIEALAADPSNTAATDALKEHAAKAGDFEPLAFALIRVGEGEAASPGPRHVATARVAAMKELVRVADKEMKDPALTSWAEQRLALLGKRAEAASGAQEGRPARSQSIMMRAIDPDEDDAMAAAEALDGAATEEAKVAALRRLAKIYRGRPHVRAEYLDVLAELARALPGERAFTAALERMTSRTGDLEPIEGVMRAWLEGSPSREAIVRARLWLGAVARRRGDDARALEEVAPLVVEAPEHQGAMCTVLVAATRAGVGERRADALIRLAGPLPALIRAVVLAVAAELYASAGSIELAAQAAELACEADSSCARAITARGMIAGSSGNHAGAAALEGAITGIAPRGLFCEALAGVLEGLGEAQLALAWTQRWVALRPGCPRAIATLIHRATALRDPPRLAEALGWVLAQPKPLADVEEPLDLALEALFDADRLRTLALARRALDVLGPTLPGLRMGLLSIADKAGDQALAISVLERWLAMETQADQVIDLLLELCRRRLDARDLDGAARELVRAAEQGADPVHILERAEAIEATARDRAASQSSDRFVSIAAARARALIALGPELLGEASDAWRRLGSLLWDLAADPRGADAAFLTASQILPDGGHSIYAHDLCEFAGPQRAVEMLRARADAMLGEEERPARAALLIEAAGIANAYGLPEEALSAAASALEIDPRRADAIVLVERAAHAEGGIDVLDSAYDLLAEAALGCFGRKAAHYRAARQLERRGAEKLALKHAVACFEAVPGTGTSYALMARIAERAGEAQEAVRALTRVADKSHPDVRADWFKRAAGIAGASEDGALTRFEMLLSALNARPDPATVEQVGVAMRQFIAQSGEADVASMRFERAVKAILGRLEGPDGARTAIALARVAFGAIGAMSTGVLALERSMVVDGDVEEYAKLVDHVDALASERGIAERFLASVRQAAERPYSSVGAALLRFASRLASALGQERASAALLVHAARRDPDDDDLVSEAHAVVHELGDIALLRALDDAVPVRRRLDALIELASLREREGADLEATSALERALVMGVLQGEERDRVVIRLRHLLGMGGRTPDIEALLRSELRRDDLGPPMRLRLARDLAGILTFRGDHRGALDAFASALRALPIDAPLLDDLRRLARRVGDRERHADVLRGLVEGATDDGARRPLLHDLAPLLHDLGEREAAAECYRSIIRMFPDDATALEALERYANERSDHEAVAALLLLRIELASPEERRALRLRRAAVLEQRLGKLDDACAELEALLEEAPDDRSALRFLADILERQGAHASAAPLLQKLGDLSTTIDEKAEYGLRAASSFLSADDVAAAKEVLDAVAPMAAREAVIELRGRIARREGDYSGLAQALDQLASASSDPSERRAEMLLEASAAASAAGDDATAMDLARRALRMAPDLPAAVLEARRLEYRARGPGAPRDAQGAADDLLRIRDLVSPEQLDLHTFLLAEALDVIQGAGAGMRELSRGHAEVGSAPLICLGMAERLVRGKNYKEALPLFQAALAGDLEGVRTRGRVAIAGADAAMSGGDLEAAARMLSVAASEPDTKPLALRRQLELTAARGDPTVAKSALEQLAKRSSGVDRARVLSQLARLQADPASAARTYAEAVPLAAGDRTLHAQLLQELARAQARLSTSHSVRPPSQDRLMAVTITEPPSSLVALASSSTGAPISITPPPPSVAPPSATPNSARVAVAAHTANEVALFVELVAGSYEAGEKLIAVYGPQATERSHDILAVRKHQAAILPGHRDALVRLRDAALFDKNQPYATAVEHVLQSFTADAPPPPPLTSQREVPDLIKPLLFGAGGAVASALHEALAMVWETGMFRRDVAQCGLSGVPRIQPGGGTVVGEAFSGIARLMGLLRTALYHQRSPGPIATQVALLSPPAVLLTGDAPRETPELAFLLGSALAGTTPEHALVCGLTEASLRSLISALLAAFGPLDSAPRGDPSTVRLGQNLWQLIPPRAARRMHEICADISRLTYEGAIEGTRKIMRRAGLFAAGDLAITVRMTVNELALPLDIPLADPDGLAAACRAHPAIADLVRLATSSEYADARWQPAAPHDRRRAEAIAGPRSRAGA